MTRNRKLWCLKPSQKWLEDAAAVDWRSLSYLTSLCNTGSIPPSVCTVYLSSPLSGSSLWTSVLNRIFRFCQSIPALCSICPIFFFPPSIFLPVSPTRVRCLSSGVVIPGPPSHWLFLRLPKPMPTRDWRVRVGPGHAGSVWACGGRKTYGSTDQ